jgi:hypothetical protein
MAAPNIVDVSTIIGKSATIALSSTSQTTLVSNAASSGKVFKINMIQVANVDGTNAADVTWTFTAPLLAVAQLTRWSAPFRFRLTHPWSL